MTINRAPRWNLRRTVALAACLLAAGAAPAGAQDLYGLVIGIDDYAEGLNDLEGAVNDADVISAALTEIGAQDLVVLRDAQATKSAIESAWYALVDRAGAGDTIVFTYAGHGSQEPEPEGRNGEDDGLNENFLLAGYADSGLGTLERIVDDEVNTWLMAADQKGIQVIFVADSCHSGTMFRSAGSPAVRYRTGRFSDPDLDEDLLTLPPPAAALIEAADFSLVTFISATQDGMLTPELIIDGQPHGALSWAFAKAIRGAADGDRDGQLTQQELLSYLVPTVQAESENQQIPSVYPLSPDARPVMPSGLYRPGAAADVAEAAPPHDPDEVRLHVLGASATVNLPGIRVVDDEAEADLIWNHGTGTVDHRIGGRVAEAVGVDQIAAVLSKWAALAFIKGRASDDPVALSLPSGNQTYQIGDVIEFAMEGARKPHLTLFNLPPNGRVELFIPSSTIEAQRDWRGRRLAEQFQVTRPPFGAEHMIAILTDQPALALHAALQSMPTAETAGGLSAALRTVLRDMPFQAGVTAIYTSGEAP
ncbi:MAG: caspase family protein [Alphaproteobacteria bacterium]